MTNKIRLWLRGVKHKMSYFFNGVVPDVTGEDIAEYNVSVLPLGFRGLKVFKWFPFKWLPYSVDNQPQIKIQIEYLGKNNPNYQLNISQAEPTKDFNWGNSDPIQERQYTNILSLPVLTKKGDYEYNFFIGEQGFIASSGDERLLCHFQVSRIYEQIIMYFVVPIILLLGGHYLPLIINHIVKMIWK